LKGTASKPLSASLLGGSAVDYDREINSLNAETIAIQNILAQVLYRISRINPSFEAAILQGFNDAASCVEDSAIIHGKAASPDHLVKAIRIIEELRTATLGHKDEPRHGV
jgi:hypothetical protein